MREINIMPQNRIPQAVFDKAVSKVSEMDWARLAAFLDGEGCIMIAKSVTSKASIPSHSYVLTVIVSNTDPRLMKWIVDTFSGTIIFSHSEKARFRSNKVCMGWRQYEGRAEVILEHCLPYLICKREQAEIGLAYRAVRRMGSKGQKVTPEDTAIREDFRNQMRKLNQPFAKNEGGVRSSTSVETVN